MLLPISAEHPNLLNDFISGLKKAYEEFYGGNPLKSDSYSKIVSSTHYKRLIELLQRTEGEYQFVRKDVYLTLMIKARSLSVVVLIHPYRRSSQLW